MLGYLAAGLLIGPFGLQFINDPHTIIHVAELGVVMFLFVIGLEMKPSHLWDLRGQIFGLGSLQVVVCAILLTFVGIGFGFPWQVAFVSAAGFVLTSTAIVMQVLSERGDIAEPRGQRMVSILLFEDLLIVPLLAQAKAREVMPNALPWKQQAAYLPGAPWCWVISNVLIHRRIKKNNHLTKGEKI